MQKNLPLVVYEGVGVHRGNQRNGRSYQMGERELGLLSSEGEDEEVIGDGVDSAH